MCFSFPPSLTIMHLCITQCTYWTIPIPICIAADFLHFIFSSFVRDLGVTLDQELTFAPHIHRLCRDSYYLLRQLRTVLRLLTSDAQLYVWVYVFMYVCTCMYVCMYAAASIWFEIWRVVDPGQKISIF